MFIQYSFGEVGRKLNRKGVIKVAMQICMAVLHYRHERIKKLFPIAVGFGLINVDKLNI